MPALRVVLGIDGGSTTRAALAQSGDYYRESLYATIRQQLPQVQICEPTLPPVLGAVLLALQLLGSDPTRKIIAKLQPAARKINYNMVME
jgi:hypothetical protein